MHQHYHPLEDYGGRTKTICWKLLWNLWQFGFCCFMVGSARACVSDMTRGKIYTRRGSYNFDM